MFGQDCFDVPNKPVFVQLTELRAISDNEKQSSLVRACREIDQPETYYQQLEHRRGMLSATGLREALFQLKTGKINSIFSFMDSSQAQKNFMSELTELKNIKDRDLRIQKVYDLVVKTMGPYDESLRNLPYDQVQGYGKIIDQQQNVGAIVDRASEFKSGGICRHHATLLEWALKQVARPTGETNWELTENSYSTEYMLGCNSTSCHTWVRLNLPYQTNHGGLKFEQIDLDTTNYRELTYLYPRLNGLSSEKQKEIRNVCDKVLTCLSTRGLRNPSSQPKTKGLQKPL